MPTNTFDYLEGFEHGVLSTAGSGLFSNLVASGTGALNSIDTTIFRNGARSLKSVSGTTAGQAFVSNDYLTTMADSTVALVMWFYKSAHPAANVHILEIINDALTSPAQIWLLSTGEIQAKVGSGTAQTGPSLATGQWHKLEIRYSTNDTVTYTLEWRVNDVAQTSATGSAGGAPSTSSVLSIGACISTAVAGNYTLYIDDVLISSDAANDYPFGNLGVKAVVPNGVGTHNLDAATSAFFFKNSGGADTAITTSETTSYDHLDEIPLAGGGDFIREKAARVAPTAAPTFVAAGNAHATNGSNPNPALPTGLVAGDFMVLILYTRNTGTGAASAPSGWTQQYNVRDSGGLLAVFTRFWQSGDTAPTVTLTNHTASNTGDSAIARIFGYRGVDATTPIGTIGTRSTNAAALNIGPISGITISGFSGVIVVGGKLDDWTSVAALSGDSLTWTEISDTPNTSGSDNGLVADHAFAGSGGATITSKTFTVTGGTNVVGTGIMFELKGAGSTTQPSNAHYVEYTLGDTAAGETPLAIRGIIGLRNESGALSNSFTVLLRVNGGNEFISQLSIATASMTYRSATILTANGAAWTKSLFDATTVRAGFSNDADPEIRFEGIIVQYVFAISTGLGATLGIAIDTSTAISLPRRKTRTVLIASETPTAIALGRSKVKVVGVASSTGTALTLGRVKTKLLGIASGVNAALPILRAGQTFALGIATSVGTALALGRLKTRLAGLATETDSAFALARAKLKALLTAPETDSSIALARGKRRLLGIATEPDTAQPLPRIKQKLVGISTEADAALVLGRVKTRLIGVAPSAGTALTLGKIKVKPIGISTEVDTALPIPRAGVPRIMGVATEADSAFVLGRVKTRALGIATSTGSALTLGRVKVRLVGVPSEANAALAFPKRKTKQAFFVLETTFGKALPFGRIHSRALGIAAETDAALATPRRTGLTYNVLTAVETDTAIVFARKKRKTASFATEADAAVTLVRVRSRALGIATSTSSAFAFGKQKTKAVSVATETDAAVRILWAQQPIGIHPVGHEIIGAMAPATNGAVTLTPATRTAITITPATRSTPLLTPATRDQSTAPAATTDILHS